MKEWSEHRTRPDHYTYMTSDGHMHRGDVTSVFASFYQRTTMHGVENLGKAKGKRVRFAKDWYKILVCSRFFIKLLQNMQLMNGNFDNNIYLDTKP